MRGGGARTQYLIHRCAHRHPVDRRLHRSTGEGHNVWGGVLDPVETLAVARVQVAATSQIASENPENHCLLGL
jgi:hypothetical protein